MTEISLNLDSAKELFREALMAAMTDQQKEIIITRAVEDLLRKELPTSGSGFGKESHLDRVFRDVIQDLARDVAREVVDETVKEKIRAAMKAALDKAFDGEKMDAFTDALAEKFGEIIKINWRGY